MSGVRLNADLLDLTDSDVSADAVGGVVDTANVLVLGDDAYSDPGFGVELDGENDFFAWVPRTTEKWTEDGSFTIAFWFTRTQCIIPGVNEYLYSQEQNWAHGSDGAAVNLMISCSASTEEDAVDGSTIPGPVIRASFRDNAGQRAAFDIPLSLEHTGGNVDNTWAHLIVTVTPTGFKCFIDGLEVDWYLFGYRAEDRRPQVNLAFPNPTQFQGDNRFAAFVVTAVTPKPFQSDAMEYIGCWTDTSDRTFTETEHTFRNDNTPVKCAQYCSGLGFVYASVRFSKTCSCSSYAPDTPTARGFVHVLSANQQECNLPCPGATHLACGGNWRNAVYRINSATAVAALPPAGGCDWFASMSNYVGPGLSYLGCHEDNMENPLFTGAHFVGEAEAVLTCEDLGSSHNCQGTESLVQSITLGRISIALNAVAPMYVELCAQKCGELGFSYIALQASSHCFCSNSSPRTVQAVPVADQQCNDNCAGAHTQWCGDGGRSSHSSIYQITALAEVPTNQCAGFSPPSPVVFGHRSGGFGYSNGYSGSFVGTIAGVELLNVNIDASEADCLFRYGEVSMGVCGAIEDMSGLHYFQSFMTSVGQLQKTLSGRPNDPSGLGPWPGHGTDAALAECVRACWDAEKIFAALEGMFCSCGDGYDDAGRADETDCDINGDGTPDCGREIQHITPDMLTGDRLLPPCVGRSTVYQIATRVGNTIYATNDNYATSYRGCWRNSDVRPAGVALFGDSYFDDGHTARSFAGAAIVGTPTDATAINDGHADYGIHFDGDGDYAELHQAATSGSYASDGTFTLSMWVTQPDCRVHGREEWLFSHARYRDTWVDQQRTDGKVNSAIAIAYGCGEAGEHTTACNNGADCGNKVHIMRVYLNDDDGNTAVFDVPLNHHSGAIESHWVHFALAVGGHTPNGTTAVAYIDGKRIPKEQIGYPTVRLGRNAAYPDVYGMQLGQFTLDEATTVPRTWMDAAGTSVDTGLQYEGCFSMQTLGRRMNDTSFMVPDSLGMLRPRRQEDRDPKMTATSCASFCARDALSVHKQSAGCL